MTTTNQIHQLAANVTADTVKRIISDHELRAAEARHNPDLVQQLVARLAGPGKQVVDISHERRLEFLANLEGRQFKPRGVFEGDMGGTLIKPVPEAEDDTAPVNLTPEQDHRLLENGYQAIPVCGKAPKLIGWEKSPITAERVSQWRRDHLDHVSTGVRTGNAEGGDPKIGTLFVLDLDLPDPEALATAETLVTEMLGGTPLRRVGQKGCALFYRKRGEPSPKRVIKLGQKGQAELFGRGQVVVFGQHPIAKQPYRWTGAGSPLTVPLSSLPEITNEQVNEFERRICELFGVFPVSTYGADLRL